MIFPSHHSAILYKDKTCLHGLFLFYLSFFFSLKLNHISQELVKCSLDFQCKASQVLFAWLMSVIAVCQVCVQSVQKTKGSTGDHCIWYLLAKQRKSKTDIPTKPLDNFLPLLCILIINYNFFLHLNVFHSQIWLHAELSAGKTSSSSLPAQVLLKPRRLHRNIGPLSFLCCLLCSLCCLSPVPKAVRPLPAFSRPGLCQQPGQKESVKGTETSLVGLESQ